MGEGPLDRDAAQLRRLGYAQQLLRDMGGFASFALSFSIISILTGAVTLYGHRPQHRGARAGCGSFAISFSIISILPGAVTLYGHGLRYGGPLEMTLGWPLVSL